MDLINFFGPPPKRHYKKTSRGHFSRTAGKLPDKWPFGRKTNVQWAQDFQDMVTAFGEKAKRTNNP